MLGIKLKSSATAASALNHRVISLAPGLMILAEDMEAREGWRVFVNTVWKLVLVVHIPVAPELRSLCKRIDMSWRLAWATE